MACNPECVKIIINGGMLAALASEFAGKVGGALRAAALELAAAARSMYTSYTVLVDQKIIAPVESSDWHGCQQAAQLAAWNAGAAVPANAAELMASWTRSMRDITASLVSGGFEL